MRPNQIKLVTIEITAEGVSIRGEMTKVGEKCQNINEEVAMELERQGKAKTVTKK